MSIARFLSKLEKQGIIIELLNENLEVKSKDKKMSSDVISAIRDKKNEIIKFLSEIKDESSYSHINIVEKKEYYYVSAAQARMFFLQQIDVESIAYNKPNISTLEGDVNKEKIEEVFRQLITRHESFRTSFELQGVKPVQRIHEVVEFNIEEINIEKEEIKSFRQQFIQAFDLNQAPLLRVAKVNVKGEGSLLMVDMHHIISDGFSYTILIQEIKKLYSGENLPPLKIQYKDYSEWQNSEVQQEKNKKQEVYWINRLAGELPVLDLPADYMRPAIQNFEGAKVSFALSKAETENIKLLTKEYGLTLYMSVLSVFTILLSRLTGQQDIIIGNPVAGRNHVDLGSIVGMFVNTLAMRNEVIGSYTLKEYIAKLKQNTLEAFEHQDYQFENLVDNLSVERNLSRNPIIDVVFNLPNMTEMYTDISGLDKQSYVHTESTSKFDLTLTAVDYGDQLMLNFVYCTKLFKSDTIEKFIRYFKQIVNQVSKKINLKISEIDIISKEEKQELLYGFNDTKVDYPKDKTVHRLFEEQVEITPNNIALEFEENEMSFQELNAKSNQLARVLVKKGVKPDTVVGIMADRSIELKIGILSILKAGGAYLPIDPTYPEDRISYILKDAEISTLLIQKKYVEAIKKTHKLDITDLNDNRNYKGNDLNLELINQFNNLAYVIYTSGSTGIPKGVMVETKGVVNTLLYRQKEYSFSSEDISLQLFSFSFDGFVTSFFTPLISGAKNILIKKEDIVNISNLIKTVVNKKVTHFISIPILYQLFLENLTEEYISNLKLKVITLAGDTISPNLIKNTKLKNRNIEIAIEYGLTECSVLSTIYRHQENNEKISIGTPISNTQIYIIDKNTKIQPIGISGELCISGTGLARGYLKKNELTSEKFIDHPFQLGERLYRTGDLARWLPDGNIEFLGRIDSQVKIRGLRIELGEIESTLFKYKNIKECVVLARKENKDKYLCAYVVKEGDFNQEEIRTYLTQQLPYYMIPSYFIEVDKMPLTINGKINRKALPSPEVKAGDDYVAPSNETEEKLVQIWSEILNVPQEEISITASFFDIGGHSLKASVLTGRIHKETGVEFPLRDVFIYTSIQSQASQINTRDKKDFVYIPKAKRQDYYTLSSAQKRLYLLQQIDLDSTAYNMPYIIPLGAEADKEKIEEAFRQLISRHESFRTSFEIEEDEPIQRIHEQVEFKLEELTITKEEEQEIRHQFIQAFDLSQAPLLRVSKVDVKGEGSLLMIDMHHIISDGVSHAILEQDFQRLHAGEWLVPLNLQYKDYSEWQNSEEQQIKVKEQENYWISKFEAETPVLDLPTDYVRPVLQSHEGATVSFALSKEETQYIKSLAKENDLTLYMALLSVFNILLSKLSGQEDIVVGMPIAGRNHSDLENIVGVFVNTLAIRNEVNGSNTLKEFIKKLKQSTLEAFENQDCQFEELVENISLERDISRNPVFDVIFNLLNQAEYSADLTDLDNQNYIHTSGISKFDITLTAVDYGEQLMLSFEYCTNLFKAETIERFIKYFKQIVNQIPLNLEKQLSEIEIISTEEKQELLYDFNEAKTNYPSDKTIHRLFEEQVLKNPDRISVTSEDFSITYNELNIRSNQLARQLKESSVEVGDIVGINTERTEELLVGILGILKCGAAYLPLNSGWPQERINFMLLDSCCTIIIHGRTVIERKEINCELVDISNQDLYKGSKENLDLAIKSSNTVYIIYTSGTTGNPKGVLTSHMNVSRVVLDNEYISINNRDNILQLSSYTFDGSVFDIYGALLNGSSLVMINNDDLLDIGQLLNIISKKQISIFFLTTALFNTIVDYGMSKLKAVRKILFGGERISVHHTQKALKELGEGRLVHVYGPTETTVFASYHHINSIDKEREIIPIGTPLSNTSIYIFDSREQIVPKGVQGEIYIGGCGNAKGYLNNVELTNDKFVINPYNSEDILYRTGDLARFLPNGSIEFLGRIDHQVKIRGFRIELGEIENVLLKHDSIQECIVIDREENDDKYLCAYLVKEEEIDQEEIRSHLSGHLPDYMIPSYFVDLDVLPLTNNGKVNRKALPNPEIKAGEDYVLPSNATEEQLVKIWSEVLNIEKEEISTTANFFSIGGHSLKASILTGRIHKEIGIDFPLRDVFLHSTVRDQANQINKRDKKAFVSIPKAEKREYYPLSKTQRGIYFYQQIMPDSTNYNLPMIIPLGDDFEIDHLEKVFKVIIERHECLRTSILVHNNEPFQRFYDELDFVIPVYTVSELNLNDVTDNILKPFKLCEEPLIRACVLLIPNKQPSLIVNLHHIISDGFSLELLAEDFNVIMNKNSLPLLRYQYRDVAVWQKKPNFLKIQEQHKKYWLTKFKTGIPELNLPIDNSRDVVESTEADRIKLLLTEEETYIIRDLVLSQKTTVFSLILNIFYIWLNKLTGDEDIIIGTPVSGRYHEDLNKICGMFVNTLALRNYPSGNKQFNQFLEETHRNVFNDFENQYFSFDELVSIICKERKVGRNPIFDVFYTFKNNKVVRTENVNEKVLTEVEVWQTGVKFDLFLSGFFIDDQIILNIDYKKSLFDRSSMEYYVTILQRIISQITKNHNILLNEIDVIENVKINKNIINKLNEDF